MDFSFNDSSRPQSQASNSPSEPPPSVDALLSENQFLKQQVADLKALYKEMHSLDLNSALKTNATNTERLLYKELRFEKARRMQTERMLKRLQKANDTRRECLTEIENFGLEVKAMAQDAKDDPASVNVEYLQKWTDSFLQRIRSYHLQTAKAERQGLFLPGTGYLDESQLDLHGLTIMDIAQGKMQDVPYLNTYNIAILENKLNDLYRCTCRLGNTVKYTLMPNEHAHEQKVAQDAVMSDAQRICQQIDSVRRELTLLGAVVPSKFDTSVKNGESGQENAEPLSYMSLNTKELLKKLPKYSRYPTECENSLRALSKCFNTQKHVWKLEKEMLQEEISFHQKVSHFFKTYTTSMLKEIDRTQKSMLPSPERPTPSSDASCIRELYDRFHTFDQDSNEENLRDLLLCFKTNGDQLKHLIESSSMSRNNRNLEQDLAKFSREVDVIEQEYKLQMDEILGRKYQLEEDLMQREMFMNFSPYMIPVHGEESSNDFYNLKSAGGADRFHPSLSSPSDEQASSESGSASRSSRTSSRIKSAADGSSDHGIPGMITTEQRVARANKKTRPPVSKQDKRTSSHLPPNVVELQDIIEESRSKLNEMNTRLETERMTEMQKYALKKQIARQKAALKKSERTLKNMVE